MPNKMESKRRYYLGIALTALMVLAKPAAPQASVASEDIIDDIPVTVNGQSSLFTVLRDARQRNQWYYVPDTPRLFDPGAPASPQPEFTLLRYQTIDPAHPQTPTQGGLLYFAAVLALPPEALEQLKAAIAKSANVPTAGIRLSALEMLHSKVDLYTPMGQDGRSTLLATAVEGTGVAPEFASQKMAFQIELTSLGADVYEALLNSTTGVPVTVRYKYGALTAPAGFRVTLDWKLLYHHFSTDEKLRAQASYFGLFGAKYSHDGQSILDALRSDNALKVDIVEGSGFQAADVEKYLQPILTRINAELLEDLKAPPVVAPAQAAEPAAGGFFGSVGYARSVKDQSLVRSGSETVDFTITQYVERETVTSGFIGIGRYSDTVKEKAVINASNKFPVAYLTLPTVGGAAGLGIDQIDLEVDAVAGQKQLAPAQTVTWTPAGGWQDAFSAHRTVIAIPLQGATPTELAAAALSTTTQITQGLTVLPVHQTEPARVGTTPRVSPFNAVDVVQVNPARLSFSDIDHTSDLLQVDVVVSDGQRKLTRTLTPHNQNGVWVAPEPAMFVVDRGNPNLQLDIRFTLTGSRRVSWSGNGTDWKKKYPSLSILLSDADWKK